MKSSTPHHAAQHAPQPLHSAAFPSHLAALQPTRALPAAPADTAGAARAPRGEKPRPTLRAIAVFEAAKGLLAAAAVLGLLSLLHHDVHRLAAALISHIGLLPGDHYPALFLHNLDQLLAADRRPLLLAATAYVGVRLVEAYGLWNQRPWACWLGALSGALYLPFEMLHLVHQPTGLGGGVVVLNVALVAYLAWQAAHSTAP